MFPRISPLARSIVLAALLNVAIAPVVYAATDGTISRSTAYALGLLALVVLGLAIYLAWVILKPEQF